MSCLYLTSAVGGNYTNSTLTIKRSLLQNNVDLRVITGCLRVIFSPDLNLNNIYITILFCVLDTSCIMCTFTDCSYRNHCQQSGSVSTTIAGKRRPPSPSREYTSLSTLPLGRPEMIEDSWGVKRSDRACK